MSKYGAIKTTCNAGHSHASKKEARRCNDLQLLERAGQISGLQQQPKFRFVIDGREVKLDNGHVAGITADWSYVENGKKVVEDAKGMRVRDFPLRWALARTLWPDIDWRVV
jgi:hypothetical protein